MRTPPMIAGATAAAIAFNGAGWLVPVAHASDYGIELNGTYEETSNGQWAKTNEVFIDEPVVRATWVISSTCSGPTECTGQVGSDQGWTARMRFSADRWMVDHEVPNWIPCPDGTTAPGKQQYRFFGYDNGRLDHTHTDYLAGRDTTIGPSGACGVNKPLVIEMPFTLRRTG
jgi:hypothetical protein